MRKILIVLFLLFICSPLAFCCVLESDQITDLLRYADQETWVICDVDNTLIESAVHLGSPQWRTYIRNKAIKTGYTPQAAEEVLDKFWQFVQHLIPVKAVDINTPGVTKKLCQSTAAVLALTAREPVEAMYTPKQLASADITLSQGQFCQNFCLPLVYPSLYQSGVIYCGDNPKGEALLAFFKEIGCLPKKVLFIDDKLEQVLEVENSMKQWGIECIGIRFSGADTRVKSFEPAIADVQWTYLPQIISDDQAKQMNTIRQKQDQNLK